jgi:hypothetical protein
MKDSIRKYDSMVVCIKPYRYESSTGMTVIQFDALNIYKACLNPKNAIKRGHSVMDKTMTTWLCVTDRENSKDDFPFFDDYFRIMEDARKSNE